MSSSSSRINSYVVDTDRDDDDDDGDDPFAVRTSMPRRDARTVVSSSLAVSTTGAEEKEEADDGTWRCSLCSVLLPVGLRDDHEKAHARRGHFAGAAMAAAAANNNNSNNSSRASFFSFPASEEPKRACIICGKLVRASIYQWHVQSCGVEAPSVTCCVCADDVPLNESFRIGCPSAHKTCIDCVHRMLEIAAREGVKARCPGEGCAYRLPSTEVLVAYRADRNNEVYQRYADFELRAATEGANFFSCKTKDCPNVVALDDVAKMLPTCMRCHLCMNSTCTLCSSQPFHYRMSCDEARQRHAMWIGILRELSGGTGGNQNLIQEARDAQERYRELQEDEKWKTQHCRLCSTCGRAIDKMTGCDTVVCGRDAHGGNQQNGCGASLNWTQLKPYAPRLPPPPAVDTVRGELLSRGSHSEYDRCVMCKKVVEGPRFLCANCPCEESFCLSCIPKFSQTRHKNHFFVVISGPEESNGGSNSGSPARRAREADPAGGGGPWAQLMTAWMTLLGGGANLLRLQMQPQQQPPPPAPAFVVPVVMPAAAAAATPPTVEELAALQRIRGVLPEADEQHVLRVLRSVGGDAHFAIGRLTDGVGREG